jgi:hypothetical protein
MEDGSDDGREVKKNRKFVSVGVEAQRKKGLRRIYSAPKGWKINSWGVLKNP